LGVERFHLGTRRNNYDVENGGMNFGKKGTVPLFSKIKTL
jgi:hypothetical protein